MVMLLSLVGLAGLLIVTVMGVVFGVEVGCVSFLGFAVIFILISSAMIYSAINHLSYLLVKTDADDLIQ